VTRPGREEGRKGRGQIATGVSHCADCERSRELRDEGGQSAARRGDELSDEGDQSAAQRRVEAGQKGPRGNEFDESENRVLPKFWSCSSLVCHCNDKNNHERS